MAMTAMFRPLEDVANNTPKDYLAHIHKNPEGIALKMLGIAQSKWPIPNIDDGVVRETIYRFLYIGPGAGLVIQTLLSQGQEAWGLETSRRGIASAPAEVRNYILWSKPWELPFTSMKGEPPVPYKMFHVAVVSKYLKELLNEDEWQETLKEIKKVSRYQALTNT
jgi:hypothetical protein